MEKIKGIINPNAMPDQVLNRQLSLKRARLRTRFYQIVGGLTFAAVACRAGVDPIVNVNPLGGTERKPANTPVPVWIAPDASGFTGQRSRPTASIPMTQTQIQEAKKSIVAGDGCPISTGGVKITGTAPNGDRVVCQSP